MTDKIHPVVEAAAKAICKSGRFETGQGTCAATCMDQLGDPRKFGCHHAVEVHKKLALAALQAFEPLLVQSFEAGIFTGARTPDEHNREARKFATNLIHQLTKDQHNG